MMGAIHSSSRRRGASAAALAFAKNWESGTAAGGETISRPLAATRFNASGVRETVSADTLRFDYDPANGNAVLGVLVEPASTNLLLQSETHTNATWGKIGCTVATGGGTGLDGSNSLATVTATGAFSGIVQSASFASGSNIRYTVWAKRGTVPWMILTLRNPGDTDTCNVWFSLISGSIGNVSGQASSFSDAWPVMRALPNGIFECSVIVKTTGITSAQFEIALDTNNQTYGNVTGMTLLVDAAQAEATSATAAICPYTSMITTTTATVTRPAETLTVAANNGTYDILVVDDKGGEWRNGVVVSGGAYTVTPRLGARHVKRIDARVAGSLTSGQKAALLPVAPIEHQLTATPPTGYKWRLIFEEEFNGTAYNSDKWVSYNDSALEDAGRGNPSNQMLEYNLDSRVSVSNGNLVLTAVRENYTSPMYSYTWTSGMLSTMNKFALIYGYIEERVRMPNLAGFWPAFWTWQIHGGNLWMETDVYEYYSNNKNQMYMTSHTGPESQGIAVTSGIIPDPPFDPAADFHTYAADMRPNGTAMYIDGVLMGTLPQYPTQLANLITNLSVYANVPPAAGTNTENKQVQYIRCWSYEAGTYPTKFADHGHNGPYYFEKNGLGYWRDAPGRDWTIYNATLRNGVSLGTLPGSVPPYDVVRAWAAA